MIIVIIIAWNRSEVFEFPFFKKLSLIILFILSINYVDEKNETLGEEKKNLSGIILERVRRWCLRSAAAVCSQAPVSLLGPRPPNDLGVI